MRRIVLMCALLLATTAYAQEETQISVPYEQFVLPNGLNVILHEDHTTPTVGVNMWYHVGSGREEPGRTGFAHLFEHILFEGSGHVPEGKFDQWLEAAGATNNGGTTGDWTVYFEDVPSNAVELALFLESDRLGYLLEAMSPEKVDGQRDVVKNERRQRIDNQPYGLAYITIGENLYPPDHPYHWPVIGSMEDLSAASYEDVVNFYNRYYGPANVSLAIAGDIDIGETRTLVEKWFNEIEISAPIAPVEAPEVSLTEEKRVVLEDKVQLPRIYISWLTPALYAPGDAEMDVLANILAGGKNSRLYKRLVYDLQIAQNVFAFQSSSELDSEFYIVATARSGHTLAELEQVIQEELDLLRDELPSEREVQRAVNQYELNFLNGLENVGGFGGKAFRLNGYYTRTGEPDYFNEDLARYKVLQPNDIRAAVQRYLRDDGRVILSIVPEGMQELAASAAKPKAD